MNAFHGKEIHRAAAVLRRKLPKIRKAAGPYAHQCVRALSSLRGEGELDATDLLALRLAAGKVLKTESWSLKVLEGIQ